jgi:pimeloyl-ACP methyl ester carboxylesterase
MMRKPKPVDRKIPCRRDTSGVCHADRRGALRSAWALGVAVAVAALVFFWPNPGVSFERRYEKVPDATAQSLQHFRRIHPPQTLMVDGLRWEYLVTGEGPETLVFLHGMAGAYDIWWQQIEVFADRYRIVSVTYPAAEGLAGLEKGLLAILGKEGVAEFNVVGASLGGYFVQYLAGRHAGRVKRAVLSNTFPPNDRIARANRVPGALLPHLPEWLAMKVLRAKFDDAIYPASGRDELTLAYLNEIGYGRMSKAQLVSRYRSVIEKFSVGPAAVPTLIIESGNDPLVEPLLRRQLRERYPGAAVKTFDDAGHFPYLNRPQEYSAALADFLSQPALVPSPAQAAE